MPGKDTPQDIIDGYRKRQQTMPFIVGGLAVVLVAVGIIILVTSLTGSGGPSISLFASKTPTVTETSTPTITFTPTVTPTVTITETPTPDITETSTPVPGPFEYEVKEGDTCWDIAANFNVDFQVLMALNKFTEGCPIKPGDKILIPGAETKLPTDTPVPVDLARGTKIEYTVKLGDSLQSIASTFNSTIDAIIDENDITDANLIEAGTKLIIPVNIATATPTLVPTSTSAPTSQQTSTP
ncbi:MAG: LysM peptidoglycan-binding domain-containing protein [Anaerolineae bacterium]|nr:LysM peptidoglycan-binding domain-containing protein [Anaerolineae bacterium]